jgi:SNF family Na+-dependent transporter
MTSAKKESWGGRVGVILAVAGSAVGLGNFLRFPGTAAENGGGAFMIPYFCALLFLGIPIGWAEWTMGRYGGRKGLHSAPAIVGLFTRGPVGRYVGLIGVLIPIAVYFYYILIESWCLAYAWKYLTGGLDPGGEGIAGNVQASQDYFRYITGAEADGALFAGGGLHPALVCFVITCALNTYFVFRGLSKGVEWVCKWAMPAMALLGLLVLARVLTLGTPDPAHPDHNVINGLGFMWNPRFEALGDPKTWLAAAGQIFFSLSVGFGVIVNYASYLRRKDDVVLSGLTASATNEFFEVALGGLITITAAVTFLGIAATSQATGSSFDLGFKTLPVVFAEMPLGNAFGAMWFLMLFLAAITSSLSMLQPAQAFVQETLGVSRGKATAVVTAWGLAGSALVIYFSAGLVTLDTIDFWVGSVLILVMAALQIVSFGWIFGLERGMEEAHAGAQLRIPGVFRFVIKYVAPLYLLAVLGGFCVKNLPGYVSALADQPNAKLALLAIAITSVVLVLVMRVGVRRLTALGVDLDDREGPPDELEERGRAGVQGS